MRTVLVYSVNTVGILLVRLLALLMLVLIIPVTAELACDKSGFAARLQVFGLRINLYPEPLNRKKKRPAETAGAPREEKKKSSFSLQSLRELLAPGATAARYLLKCLRIYDIDVTLIADGKDPAGTAIAAGRMWAAFGVFASTLKNAVKTAEFRRVDILPDFNGEHAGEEKGSCKIRACAGIIVAAGIVFLKRYIKQKRQCAAGKKEAAK